jgi:hypothetical protein
VRRFGGRLRGTARGRKLVAGHARIRPGYNFWDVNVSSAGKVFDASGQLLDDALPRRVEKMVGELVWMARALRYARGEIAAGDAATVMSCPNCGNVEMRASALAVAS